jgi:aryl-alcohol dehydrogenase-like predicted oxidoreductase
MGGAASRLAIGTVQFGLAYGVTHGGGRVADGEVRAILAKARDAGIDTLDTAAGYGDAEDALGRAGAAKAFHIITKTAASGGDSVTAADIDRIETRFRQSLEKLGVPAVDGVLVHAVSDLLAPGGELLWKRLEDWRSQGLARRIGVSVYDKAEIDAVLMRFTPEIVQLPLNVLDQRLLADGSIARLAERGVAIHVRSLFLQGLLLQEPSGTPVHLSRTKPFLERWWAACAAAKVSPLAAALGFGLGVPRVERFVVGVHSTAHLAEILAAIDAPTVNLDWPSLAAHDATTVDPRRWPKP